MELKLDGLAKVQEEEQKAQNAAKARTKKAQAKKAKAQVDESWDEAWKRIFNLKAITKSAGNKEKAEKVKAAIESGKLELTIANKKISYSWINQRAKDLDAQANKEYLDNMIANTPANYHLIQTKEALDKVLDDLEHETIIAVDTETTGLDVYNDVLVGISLTLPWANYHVYIPVGHRIGEQLDRDYVLEKLRPVLESPFIRKVLHNAKFDMHMFIRHGVRLRGVAHDTMIAMALLNDNEPVLKLKVLATKYGKYFGFEVESKDYQELFGTKSFADVPLDAALVYAAKDTHLTWEFYQWQMTHFKKREKLLKLYQEIENAIIDVCVEMEQTGFLIDTRYAKEYGDTLRAELAEVEARLRESFGVDPEFNFNSNPQLSELLYVKLGLPDKRSGSVDEKALDGLKNAHEGIQHLLKYRELTKLLSTYVEALPNQKKSDGRVHGSFNQIKAVTGRFSSSEPNLQNLPPAARKLIIAPPGKILLGMDFSQIEPRVLAHMSGDYHMREPYLKGQDLYSTLASRVFNVPIEECGDKTKYRDNMKTGLLAVMYGTSMWTLADQLSIPVEEAQQFILDFYASHPDVYRFVKDTYELVKHHEYVETLYGRKRRFPGHRNKAIQYDSAAQKICDLLGVDQLPSDWWKYPIPYDIKRQFREVKREVESARRQAVNARIQGSAADIMKRALINLYRHCEAKGRGWRVNGTVHDEALILVNQDITLEEIKELEACMTSAGTLEVPIKVDTEIMLRWGEGIKKGEWFKSVA